MAADWEGNFGDDYTERNLEIADRSEFFKSLDPYNVRSALEVGCNVGTNMEYLKEMGCEVAGVDLNAHALNIADKKGLEVYYGNANDLDIASDEYDLVFTVGVLIHLNTPDLIRAMQEMRRVSRKFVMFAEYYGDDIEVEYHGERGALIKRDYGGIYRALFPEAQLVEKGFLGKEQGFDDVTYWIFYDVGDSASTYGIDEVAWESNDGSERSDVAFASTGTIGASRVGRRNRSCDWAYT